MPMGWQEIQCQLLLSLFSIRLRWYHFYGLTKHPGIGGNPCHQSPVLLSRSQATYYSVLDPQAAISLGGFTAS